MKRKIKRGLALLLAVGMVSGLFLNNSGNFLLATDGEAVETVQGSEEAGPVEKKEILEIPAQEESEQEEPEQEEPAEQEIPAESEAEETDGEGNEAQGNDGDSSDNQEVPGETDENTVPAETEEAPSAESTETSGETITEADETQTGEEGMPETETVEETESMTETEETEENFEIVFVQPEIDGGVLYVWSDGKEKETVSFGGGNYIKEAEDGSSVYFEIAAEENYEVAKVSDEDGNVLRADGGVYCVTAEEDKEITIEYEETAETIEDAAEKLLKVTFLEPEMEGIALSVWTEGEEKQEAVYDENGSYIKEVEAGAQLSFEVSAESGYVVNDEDGNVLEAREENGNSAVYTIEVAEDKEISFAEIRTMASAEKSLGDQKVYVYVKLNVEDPPAGWKPNANGWYTIGEVEIDNFFAAGNQDPKRWDAKYQSNDFLGRVLDAVDNGNGVDRHQTHKNIKLDFSKISWESHNGQNFGLTIGNGAADYVAAGKGWTWHLDGYLDVKRPAIVTITGNQETAEYNGQEQSVCDYEIDGPEDITVTLKDGITAEAKGTDVGTYKMGLTEESFEIEAPEYYDLVQVIVNDGTLTITPSHVKQTVIINGNTDTKVYNGSEQQVTGYTYEPQAGSQMEQEEITVTPVREIKAAGTDADKYRMNLTPQDFEVTAKNYSNIDVIVNDGWLEITPTQELLTINITGAQEEKTYNGQEQSVTGFSSDAPADVTVALKEGKTASVTGKNVKEGNNEMGLRPEHFTATSQNYKNIAFVITKDGSLKINPATFTVTALDNGKVTGETDPKLTYAATGEVNGEEAGFTGALEREAGETRGTYEITQGTLTLKQNGTFYPENYTVEFRPGIFTIDDAKYAVTKRLTNSGSAPDGSFKANETAQFEITVKNTGRYTVKNITVTDELSGGDGTVRIIPDNEIYSVNGTTATIASLEPEASAVIRAEYTVTQSDVDDQHKIVNIAAAGEERSDAVEVPVESRRPEMDLTKEVTSAPRIDGKYNVGETVKYQITVENSGNTTLNNIVITDKFENAGGVVVWDKDVRKNGKNQAVIDSIEPGQKVNLNCSYTVAREDAGKELVNTVSGDSDETDPTEWEKADSVITEGYYKLTINYIYTDGSEAAPSVKEQYLRGETFMHRSPEIEGYAPDYAFVQINRNGMPAEDIEIDIVYRENPAPTVPVDPTEPGVPTDPVIPEEPADPTAPIVPTVPETPELPAVPEAPAVPDAAAENAQDIPEAADAQNNPGLPAARNTTEANVNAAAGNDEAAADEPMGGEIRISDDGELEIVPVAEEEVPLANRNLDSHECCILHFLLMLAAMLVYAFYTRSMKKRQKRIVELEDVFQMETLRRK